MNRVVRRLRQWWGAAIVVVAFACLVTTGFVGLDFGFHWDEPIQLGLVNRTMLSGSFLPNLYRYPSVTYLLSLLGVLPHVLTGIGSHKLITANQFYLSTRGVFLVVTSLGGIWLYLSLRRRAGEFGAAFGAATYLLSFELAYHARWIAPDAVMTMAAALFLWFFVIAWDSPGSTWRTTLPAVAAGFAAATKYQGAVLMVPVVVLFVKAWRADTSTMRVQLLGVLRAIAVFIVTFVVLTPGAILQRRAFIHDVREENSHYRTGHLRFKGTSPYDVRDHVTYLARLARYVAISLPSHSLFVSVFVIALAILGVATLVHREPWFALAIALPLLIAPLYFSTLVVFIVRNFLFVLPFVAFFAGIGVGRAVGLAMRFARPKIALGVLVAGCSLAMILNGAWLVHAAQTITDRGPAALVQTSDSYMRDRPGKHFVVSGPVLRQFRMLGRKLPPNARARGPADYFVVFYSQINRTDVTLAEWPATERGTYRAEGPLEVNFDFYPTWNGADRVLIMTPKEADRFGLTHQDLRLVS